MKVVYADKGRERTVTLTATEIAALSMGGDNHSGYTTWVDLYATHEQAQAVVEQELKGTIYLLRDDAFIRNGLQVHRIYLNNRYQQVRVASKYFDAWNHCQHCGSFDVSIYHKFMSTVFCHKCKLHRKYRPHAPGGMDAGSSKEPDLYELAFSRLADLLIYA